MYDTLIESSQLALQLVVGLALLYLIVGLVSPSRALARGRGRVVLRAALATVIAVGAFVGVIAYTHSQPDGPHSIKRYLDDVPPEQWEQWRKDQ